MLSKKYLVPIITILIFGSSAPAKDTYSKQYHQCMKEPRASQGSTHAITNCTSQEIKYQDKQLKHAYKTLKKNFSEEKQKELLIVQELWVKYRDANCNLYDDGGMYKMHVLFCILDETERRTRELKDLLEFVDL